MKNIFIDNAHKSRYFKLLTISKIHEHDLERRSLLYIIAGNEDLYLKRKAIYDFNENCILIECFNSDKVDFCSSSKALIRLAFNLFNGYADDYSNPVFLLCGLDSKNFFIACQAILLRLICGHKFWLLPINEDRAMLGSNPSA